MRVLASTIDHYCILSCHFKTSSKLSEAECESYWFKRTWRLMYCWRVQRFIDVRLSEHRLRCQDFWVELSGYLQTWPDFEGGGGGEVLTSPEIVLHLLLGKVKSSIKMKISVVGLSCTFPLNFLYLPHYTHQKSGRVCLKTTYMYIG
jgi:hypothetical protein